MTFAPEPHAVLAEAESLKSLYGLLAPLHIGAGWAMPTPPLWDEPRPEFRPAHWHYTDAKAGLDAAGRRSTLNWPSAATWFSATLPTLTAAARQRHWSPPIR